MRPKRRTTQSSSETSGRFPERADLLGGPVGEDAGRGCEAQSRQGVTRSQRVIDVASAKQDLARARHIDQFVAHEPPDEGRDLFVVREEAVTAEVEPKLAEAFGARETADDRAGLENERFASRGRQFEGRRQTGEPPAKNENGRPSRWSDCGPESGKGWTCGG